MMTEPKTTAALKRKRNNLKDKFNDKFKESGITVISLIIAIIILVILAAISIGAMNGGLINHAFVARENAEIAGEKETIQRSVVQATVKNKYNAIKKNEVQKEIDSSLGENVAKVLKDNEDLYVYFQKTNRTYKIDSNGKVTYDNNVDMAKDKYPGDITKDAEGRTLTGTTPDDAYQINCIEDLCAFSNSSNIPDRRSYWSYENKYVKLMRDLDFKSDLSYINGHIDVEGEIESCNSFEELMNLLTNTTGTGFTPVASYSDAWYFKGTFDGNYYTISNLFENLTDKRGGLFCAVQNGTIKNLTVDGNITSNVNTGGIAGYGRGTSFFNCINRVNVTCTANNKTVGGIVADNYTGPLTIINCSNYGNISGGNRSAGIYTFDWSDGDKIYNCLNAGSARYAIVDTLIGSNSVMNCINYGTCTTTFSKGTTLTNCSYLNGSVTNSNASIVGYDEEYFKSEEYVESLNTFIEENTVDADIGWAKWVYNEGDYPTLDLKTIWNGSEWVTTK